MGLDEYALLEVLETSPFLVPELEGRVARLWVPKVQGRITSDSDPFANLVGAATLDDEHVEETIWQVRDIYASEGKEFGWLVGPLSTPGDLAYHLTEAGLARTTELAGMVHTDLGRAIPTNPAVAIHEATHDDLELAVQTLADAMGISPDRTRAMTEALFLSPEPIERRVYLAFVEGVEEPVATASMIYVPDQPIVLLLSAATREDFRGYGIYTSLMARRLADARQDGIEAAIIQAVRSTSAPICRKLGFTEIASLELFTGNMAQDDWRPAP